MGRIGRAAAFLLIEARSCSSPATSASRASEGVGVLGWHDSSDVWGDQLGDSADGGGDDRLAEGQCFAHHHRLAFVVAGDDEYVGGGHPGEHVVGRRFEGDDVADAEVRGESAVVVECGPLADGDEAE